MRIDVLRALTAFITIVVSTSTWAANVLLIEDTGGFGGASGVLLGDGHMVTVINGEFANSYANLQNLAFLQGFDIVVWGARGAGFGTVTPAGVTTTLESYLQAGGHLIVTGYDTIGSPTDTGLAALVRSSTSGDQVSGNATWNTAAIDNFILNGPFGDFRSLSFTATGYDDDNLTADVGAGAVALVTFPPGDRVIYTDLAAAAGSVGYWNGGVFGSTNAQPDFSDGANPQNIFRNWITGIQGVPADLEVTKTDDADGTLLPGDLLTYTITVTNNGPGNATLVEVVDDLPPTTTWQSDTCGAGPPVGNTLTWNVGNLNNGNSASCDVTVLVSEPGTLVNFVAVSGFEDDPDLTNNEDVTSIDVEELIIPTLNQIGLVLLVLVLGTGSFLAIRRRRRVNG